MADPGVRRSWIGRSAARVEEQAPRRNWFRSKSRTPRLRCCSSRARASRHGPRWLLIHRRRNAGSSRGTVGLGRWVVEAAVQSVGRADDRDAIGTDALDGHLSEAGNRRLARVGLADPKALVGNCRRSPMSRRVLVWTATAPTACCAMCWSGSRCPPAAAAVRPDARGVSSSSTSGWRTPPPSRVAWPAARARDRSLPHRARPRRSYAGRASGRDARQPPQRPRARPGSPSPRPRGSSPTTLCAAACTSAACNRWAERSRVGSAATGRRPRPNLGGSRRSSRPGCATTCGGTPALANPARPALRRPPARTSVAALGRRAG